MPAISDNHVATFWSIRAAERNASSLSDRLLRHPELLETLLTSPMQDSLSLDFFIQNLRRTIQDGTIQDASDYDELLRRLQRWAHDQIVLTGSQILWQRLSPISHNFSYIVEAVLAVLVEQLEVKLATRKHTYIPGAPAGAFAVVAMGKLGERALTINSDLDLIFIYDTTGGDTTGEGNQSDGSRTLDPFTYYTRLAQSLLTALTASVSEKQLYEVDLRLRPFGNNGSLICSLESFANYQRNPPQTRESQAWEHNKAWTWEHQALLRARVIYPSSELTGSGSYPVSTASSRLARRIEDVIHQVLIQPRNPELLAGEVASMRARIEKEHSTKDVWSVKYLRGGLLDIEFLTQYLQLAHAARDPSLLRNSTRSALKSIKDAHLLSESQADLLLYAHSLYTQIQALGRLMTNKGDQLSSWHHGKLAEIILITAAESAQTTRSADTLKQHIQDLAHEVHELFRELIEEPAQSYLTAPTMSLLPTEEIVRPGPNASSLPHPRGHPRRKCR